MDKKTAKKIKSKDTKIELLLGSAIWAKKLRYRKNCKDIFGKPDFCFKSRKIAIFCDSEFWHGKNFLNGEQFKTNANFWETKIKRNIDRDNLVNQKLKQDGWIVLRFWGKDIQKNMNECINIIEEAYEKNL
jgi:DNA mismatch endonuclease (patch repair protein)